MGQPRRNIQPRQGVSGPGEVGAKDRDFGDHVGEQGLFQSHRLVAGLGYLALQFAQFERRKTHGVGHGLAVHEGGFVRQQCVGLGGGDLDEISQHVVVADFQFGHAGLGGIAGLEPGDVAAAFVSQFPQRIQGFVVAGANKAAVPGQHGEVGRQGGSQSGGEVLMVAQVPRQFGQTTWQRVLAIQKRAKRCGAGKCRGDGGQIPGPAAVHGAPCQRPFHVGAIA